MKIGHIQENTNEHTYDTCGVVQGLPQLDNIGSIPIIPLRLNLNHILFVVTDSLEGGLFTSYVPNDQHFLYASIYCCFLYCYNVS